MSFDKKLAELDAYLQMLIVENDSIDKKVTALSSSSSSSLQNIAAHDNEREGLISIKTNLETLISSIKHAIVLLQIARVSSRGTDNSSEEHHRSSKHRSSRTPKSQSSPPIRPNRSLKHTASFGSGSRDSCSNNSSFDCSASNASYNSQSDCSSKKKHCITRKGSPSISSTTPSTRLEVTPVKAEAKTATAVTPDLRRQQQQSSQRDSFGHNHHHQYHQALSSSSSAGLSKETTTIQTSENRYCTSKLNVLVNLGDADGAANGERQHDVAVADEEDEDAFFDAADEQEISTRISLTNQPTVNDNSNTKKSTNTTENISKLNENELHVTLRGQNIDKQTQNATTELTKLQISDSSMAPPKPSRGNPQPIVSEHQQQSSDETNNNNDNTIEPHLFEDGSIDWDAMYEDEEEEELDSMDAQGSVIKHLLSQIRIGMDLTKVVLPTFILERRSLLEMYADFFAHPDLFSTIPDFETPEERMVQLVKWYLSAFHAGRRSSVAKKPYNPILGEIFRCSWNLVEKEREATRSPSSQLSEQRLTFVAEQVSHHPPVSAFYAENKEKSISCCAHIYTKSKYLGLSVGVHNLGYGEITLHQHNETYKVTFPSAYGRSILTVPWVELGGSVDICCAQTGYKAKIEFVTKPFYGGKKHRVTGEILRPNNELFLSIDGEWNGIMYSKSPPNSSEKRVFVDTTNLPVIKKQVKSISAQETFESRNVWKEVTRALKLRDVNSATAAKSYIEQRQRDLLKERQENGEKWRTRFFEPVDEGWRFTSQLESKNDNNGE